MKESGLEKLIELFRDYVENYGNDTKDPTIDNVVIYDGQGFYFGARFYSDEKVLSKKFGFIKRLVENDKIDRSKFYDKNILKGFMTLTKEEKADSIIMNLSISDTPIDDLVSYLKNV